MTNSPSLGALFRLTLASGVSAAVALHLKRGAPLNGRDAKGRTPLILAAARGHTEVCRLLIKAGADQELRDEDGQDALAAAWAGRHTHVAALLVGRTMMVTGGEDVSVPAACALVSSQPTLSGKREFPSKPDDVPTDNAEDREALQVAEAPSVEAEPASESVKRVTVADDDHADGGQAGAARVGKAEASVPPTSHADEGAASETASDIALASEPGGRLAPGPAEVAPTDAFWEPEPEPLLCPSEAHVELTAFAVEVRLTRHTATIADPDWLDTEIVLPDAAPLWATTFVDASGGYRAVVALLEAAMREGWLPAEEIDALQAQATSPEAGEVFVEALLQVLGEVGAIVEAEHALDLPTEIGSALDPNEPGARSKDVAEAIAFLDGIAGEFLNAENMLLDAARGAPVLSAREETSLFRELALLLDVMQGLAERSRTTPPILLGWAEQLEAGQLAPRDVSDHEWVDKPGSGEPSQDREDREEEETSDDERGAQELSAAEVLASRLREVAGKLRTGEIKEGLIGLELTSRRVLDLADAGRQTGRCTIRRRREGSRRSHGVPELHLLSRRRSIPETPQPTHDMASALDRYLETRTVIVEGNLRRVVWFARRYARSGASFLDLVQEGQIGLLRAIDLYDVGRGWRFGTYATWWIRQSMTRFVQDSCRTVRVPVHLMERIAKTRRCAEAFRVRHGLDPSAADLARAMEIDVKAVERALAAEGEIVPLDSVLLPSVAEDDDLHSTGYACVPELVDSGTPFSTILHADLRQHLVDALRELGQRPARILDLRFGLTDGNGRTLEEVGKCYNVTRERIRQIEAKALSRLARHLPSRHFESMVP